MTAFADDPSLGAGVSRLIDGAPVGLLALNKRREILDVNGRTEMLLGSSGPMLCGRALSQFVYHDCPLFDLLDRAEDLRGEVFAQSVRVAGPGITPATLSVRIVYDEADQTFVAALARYNAAAQSDDAMGLANLARVLGHEIKNPLAGLSGAAQLLSRSARDDQKELLGLIAQEAERIKRLVDRIAVFETYSAPRLRPTNIHEILETVATMESVANPGVTFEAHYDPSLPEMEGDPDHLHEALLNLVRNAAEAAGGQAHPMVTLSTQYQAGLKLPVRGKGLTGAFSIRIEDNGEGIPPAVLSRIFDPFFTTKRHGTGVGLPLVNDIVSAHGGRLSHQRRDNRTVFEVLLPLPKKKRRS